MIGIDTGPLVAAINKCGIKQPDTWIFPRGTFYRDLGLAQSRKWSEGRASHGASQPAVRVALKALKGIHAVGSWRPAQLRGLQVAWGVTLRTALIRAIKLERGRGRHDIWQHRMSLCCCACGAVTKAALVHKPAVRKGEQRIRAVARLERLRSTRIRSCKECGRAEGRAEHLRDRDMQAARNTLRLPQHQYYGAPRPQYLCRQPAAGSGGGFPAAAGGSGGAPTAAEVELLRQVAVIVTVRQQAAVAAAAQAEELAPAPGAEDA